MLNVEGLKSELYNILSKDIPNEGNSHAINTAKQKAKDLANSLADAIDTFVKSGQVDFASGQVNGNVTDPQTGTPIPLALGTATKGVIS